MPTWFPIAASTALAVIPVIIWLTVLPKENEGKGIYIKTFLIGTFSVIPPFLLIFLFNKFPGLNIYSAIDRTIEQAALNALITNIVVGIIEEIAKNLIVRFIDKRHPEYIQTIGAALRLSICAGLGFSFAENIFYFYNIWINPAYRATDLFATFIFRSLFTMCGHMIFSGIFGYYFGIGKFATDITEFKKWKGSKLFFTHILSKLTGEMPFQITRELKNLEGLFLAMALHATFNASLDLQHVLPSILIIVLSASYIWYLLKTKSGHLLFSVIKRRTSSMVARDEDVVMELMGMWLKEGRLTEVIQTCDRLLQRDPDNNVIKLFRTKALDNQNIKNFYNTLKKLFSKTQSDPQQKHITLNTSDEKILNVANNLLAQNPNSEGAKVLLEKTVGKEKLEQLFNSISNLFKD